MRCAVAQLWEDGSWRFEEIDTAQYAHWVKPLKLWKQLDRADGSIQPIIDDLLLSWDQNHVCQSVLFFMTGGTRLHGIVKFVTGALDPSLCWLTALVVAPHVRRQGLGSLYLDLTRTFITRTHPKVQRIALTPLEPSKPFWSARGFGPLAQDRNRLADVITTLGGTGLEDAPLAGIEVWVWTKPKSK